MTEATEATEATLGNTGSNSDTRPLGGFQTHSHSLRFRARALRGKFTYRSAGRNSCGSVPVGREIFLFQHASGSVSYSDTLHCNSLSSCPACRARILSRRAAEIQSTIDLFLSYVDICDPFVQCLDRRVFLVTLTVSHSKRSSLKNLLGQTKRSGLRAARSYLFSQSRLSKEPWFFGYISGLEVQIGGKNGFHPHLHCLVFTQSVDADFVKSRFVHYWQQATSKFGLYCNEHGVDVRSGVDAASYVAKWTCGSELSDAGMKKSSASFSAANLEYFLVESQVDDDLRDALQIYYNELYGVRFHTFSRSLKFFREIYKKTSRNTDVVRVIGLYSSDLDYSDLNEIETRSVADIYLNLGAQALSEVLVGYREDLSDWYILSSLNKDYREDSEVEKS